MTGFLLIRHGSCAHLGVSLAGRSPGIHLNAEGRKQAAALARRLAGSDLHAIYSSPRERARETAAPLSARLGLAVEVSDALDEIDFGEWTGRTFDALRGSESWRRWNAARAGASAPGGESARAVEQRVTGELERLRIRHEGGWVALVSHADVIRTALAHLAGIPLDLMLRLEIDPGSLSAVALHAGAPPRILRINDAPCLPWPVHARARS